MPTFSNALTGAAIAVKVTPRAKATEVAGLMADGTIKIRVAAAPEGGAANNALIGFLSHALKIPANQIDIMGGFTSERKLISLIGVSPADVEATMVRLAAAASRARAEAAGKPAPVKKNNAKKKK